MLHAELSSTRPYFPGTAVVHSRLGNDWARVAMPATCRVVVGMMAILEKARDLFVVLDLVLPYLRPRRRVLWYDPPT